MKRAIDRLRHWLIVKLAGNDSIAINIAVSGAETFHIDGPAFIHRVTFNGESVSHDYS